MTKFMRPDIFRYHDYREFLKDWLTFLKKAGQSRLTAQALAKLSGIAPSYLSMVHKGKRDLSPKQLNKMLPHLSLNPREQKYFRALILLGTSDVQSERLSAFSKMKKYRAYRDQNPKETEVYQYLTHWYYVAIREMAALPEFQADPTWIQTRLRYPVPIKEIEEALQFLVKEGYLQLNATGGIIPPSENLAKKNINCLGGVYRLALTQFHHETLDLAKESILGTPSSERKIVGHTFALTQESWEKAQQIADEAIDKIRQLEEQSRTADNRLNEVYHFEAALFPLTGRKKP